MTISSEVLRFIPELAECQADRLTSAISAWLTSTVAQVNGVRVVTVIPHWYLDAVDHAPASVPAEHVVKKVGGWCTEDGLPVLSRPELRFEVHPTYLLVRPPMLVVPVRQLIEFLIGAVLQTADAQARAFTVLERSHGILSNLNEHPWPSPVPDREVQVSNVVVTIQDSVLESPCAVRAHLRKRLEGTVLTVPKLARTITYRQLSAVGFAHLEIAGHGRRCYLSSRITYANDPGTAQVDIALQAEAHGLYRAETITLRGPRRKDYLRISQGLYAFEDVLTTGEILITVLHGGPTPFIHGLDEAWEIEIRRPEHLGCPWRWKQFGALRTVRPFAWVGSTALQFTIPVAVRTTWLPPGWNPKSIAAPSRSPVPAPHAQLKAESTTDGASMIDSEDFSGPTEQRIPADAMTTAMEFRT